MTSSVAKESGSPVTAADQASSDAIIAALTRAFPGKTTIARAVERHLFDEGRQTMLLDGDMLRHGLNGDLGFSPADKENIRRVGEVARLFFEQGWIVLCAFVSPYAADRDAVRRLFPDGRFHEVLVDCDVDTLRQRDPKQLYAAADAGAIAELTGVSAPFEAPEAPELVIARAGPASRTPLSRCCGSSKPISRMVKSLPVRAVHSPLLRLTWLLALAPREPPRPDRNSSAKRKCWSS